MKCFRLRVELIVRAPVPPVRMKVEKQGQGRSGRESETVYRAASPICRRKPTITTTVLHKYVFMYVWLICFGLYA